MTDVRFVSGVPEVSLKLRVCSLLTGYGWLGAFMVRRNLVPDGSCVCGELIDDALQVLCSAVARCTMKYAISMR